MLILVTNGGLTLNADESQKLSNALLQLLESKDTAPTAIQCIKSLIQLSYVLKKIIWWSNF